MWRSEVHRDIFGKSSYEGKGKGNFKYILNKQDGRGKRLNLPRDEKYCWPVRNICINFWAS